MCTLFGALGPKGAFAEAESEVEFLDLPKAEQGTRHEGVPEQFVPSHMRLLASYSRDQLDGLLGGEGVHCLGRKETTTDRGLALFNAVGDAERKSKGAGGKGCKWMYRQVGIMT